MAKAPAKLTRFEKDALYYGGNVANLRKSVRPADFQHIIKFARKGGYEPNDFLDSSIPNAMKARTPAYLKSLAQKNVNAAYAPAAQELTSAETKAKAIDAKRAADNKYYLDWLTSQHAQLAAHAQAADQAILDRQHQIATDAQARYTGQAQDLSTQMQNQPGNVSNPSQSAAISGITPAQKANLDSIAAERTLTSQSVASGQAKEGTLASANFAFESAQEAKRQGDLNTALTDIGSSRIKLNLSKAADSQKELNRLLSNEQSKVESNRSFAAALQKLGLTAQSQAEQRRSHMANERIAQQNADTTAGGLKERQKHDRFTEGISAGQLSVSQGNLKVNQGRLQVERTKAANARDKANGGLTPAQRAKENDQYQNAFNTFWGARVPTKYDKKGKVTASRGINNAYDAHDTVKYATSLSKQLHIPYHVALAAVKDVFKSISVSGSYPGQH